jgi:proteic killer suppression protein
VLCVGGTLRFQFKTKKIEALYTEERGARKYPPEVVDAFFDVMAIISAAKDERDLYTLKGLHFEKLTGDRKGEHSIRLNKQWRITLVITSDEEGNYLVILDIEDYHR